MKQDHAIIATHALTDEQFAVALAKNAEVEDAGVSAEPLRMREVLGSYRTETLHWAECRSAVQPSLVPAARRAERWAALPRWSLATVALVTILGGLAHFSEYGSTTGRETSTAVVAKQAAPADIAADNRLLSSINAELNYHSASPVDDLGLQDKNPPITSAEDGETE